MFIGDRGANKFKGITAFLVEQAFFNGGGIQEHIVHPAGLEIQIGIVGVAVTYQLHILAKVVGQILVVGGGNLYAHFLARQAFLAQLKITALGGHKLVGHQRIFAGKVHGALALFGNGHGGDNGIIFTRQQRRNNAVPVLGHQLALHLHLLTQGIGHVYVKALQLAIFIGPGKGRISPFNAKTHGFPFLCLHRTGGKGSHDGTSNPQFFHDILLMYIHLFNKPKR